MAAFCDKPVHLEEMLFIQSSRNRVIRTVLNNLLEKEPQLTNTILAIVFFPVFKWSLYGETNLDLMQFADDAEWASDISGIKDTFREIFGFGDKLVLKKRETSFELAREIVETIEKSVLHIAANPENGVRVMKIFYILLNHPNAPEVSAYEVKKYLPLAIQVLYEDCGKTLNVLMSAIMNDCEYEQEDDAERAFAYHNMRLLLKEYSRLMWAQDDKKDQITQVLRCKTVDEVYETTQKINVIYSADVVLRFLLLITGGIALLGYWPKRGTEYVKIIKMLVMNRNVPLQNGKVVHIKEEDVAQGLGMCPSLFSMRKKEAYTFLGILLWGYDSNAFVDLMLHSANDDE